MATDVAKSFLLGNSYCKAPFLYRWCFGSLSLLQVISPPLLIYATVYRAPNSVLVGRSVFLPTLRWRLERSKSFGLAASFWKDNVVLTLQQPCLQEIFYSVDVIVQALNSLSMSGNKSYSCTK